MQDRLDSNPDHRRPSRAILLLRRAITRHQVDRQALASALLVSPEDVEAYEVGSKPMPPIAQAHLATFVIEHVPPLARTGHSLRAQLAAARDFHDGRTVTHNSGPPRR
jgi:hypothetical protein